MTKPPGPDAPRPISPARIALAFAGTILFFGALIFVPAGRLDWPAGWVHFATVLASFVATYVYVQARNPGLIEQRMRFPSGTKRWDVLWAWLFAPLFLSIYAVAGLDAARFGWSSAPAWLLPVGLAVFLLGSAVLIRAMAVNPFFEKTVRIQTERGHRVIDTGPYAFVRHPGYVGFAGWIVAPPLMLGSLWALVPAALSLAALIVRTALEDRTLRAELDGYAAYAGRVRYRLVPGVW